MRPPVHSADEVTRRLARLTAWRDGPVVAAAAIAALAAAGLVAPAAGVVAAVTAVVLRSGASVARHVLLDALALRDDLAEIPAVARARRRLVDPKRRREVAAALRTMAAQRGVSRHDVAPVVIGRLGAVRGELLALAAEVEHAVALDPRTMTEIARLVTDGAHSPLLNAAVPESELDVVLRRIRFRLATVP
ncbi:MAG: hypothetical protein QOH72_3280 [Solirubrobacteraceae bacterium]|jgi:hypothetical protein|nr:hypothetical protein [Solirubrobacteraceae bacterium]